MPPKKTRALKPKAEAKGDMLRVRVTDEQRAAFDEAAKRLGVGLSAFARMAMLKMARDGGVKV
jgi:hypothetical protein